MTDQTPASVPSANRTIMVILSYLGILALVPLLVEKGDKEVQWHAKHGLVLLVVEIILFIALAIIGIILGHIPVLGCLTGALLHMLLWLAILVVHIMCIVKGVNGQRFTLPYISEYADRF